MTDDMDEVRKEYLRWLDWQEGNTIHDYPNTYYYGHYDESFHFRL